MPRGSVVVSSRVRPGVLVSVLAHAGVLAWLAFALAFHEEPQPPTDPEPPMTMVTLPPPPPPPEKKIETPRFKPDLIPPLKGVTAPPPPLVLPAVVDLNPRVEPKIATDPDPVIRQPRVISRINPDYPERAIDRAVSGYVDIEGIVAPDGSFSGGKLIAETPEGYGFAKALFAVIPKWRFEPRTVDGKPVPYQIRYRFSFAMRN